MAKRTVEESSLTAVADAIRERAGISKKLKFPEEHESVVEGIPDLAISILDGSATEVKHAKVTGLRMNIFRSSGLQKADFPAVKNVGLAAFHSCASLVSVNLPEATKTEAYSFFACTSLETITLPKATHLDSESFNGCTKLRKVDLSSLVQIYTSCFSGCTSLEALIIRRTDGIPFLTSVSPFANTPIEKGTGYVYVPRKFLSDTDASSDFRRATNWSAYKFRVLQDYTVDGTVTGELDWNKINAELEALSA